MKGLTRLAVAVPVVVLGGGVARPADPPKAKSNRSPNGRSRSWSG